MAWHVFLGGAEWCTRDCYSCVHRLSAKYRTVSDQPFLLTSTEMDNVQSHIATWPQKIQISPAQEKAIAPREFHQWANQNNGVLCRIAPQRRPETPPNNENMLGLLINLLAEKSMVSLFRDPRLRCDMLTHSKVRCGQLAAS